MEEFKIVDENTNLSKCEIYNTDWDFEYDGKSQQVVRIVGYYHSFGGRFSENDYYAFELDTIMTNDSLIPFCADPVKWGVIFDQTTRYRNKWNSRSYERSATCWITRNGKNFYECFGRDMSYALAKAQYTLVRLQEECPFDLSQRSWKEKAIGQKVYYHDQPGIITRITDNNEVFIEPDGIDSFEPQKSYLDGEDDVEYDRNCWKEDYGSGLRADLLCSSINWYRTI